MMNRRTFLRSAAGLFVASTALALPERKVWALDQTMIPDRDPMSCRTRIAGVWWNDSELADAYGTVSLDGMKVPVPRETVWSPAGMEHSRVYDVVLINGESHWITAIDEAGVHSVQVGR